MEYPTTSYNSSKSVCKSDGIRTINFIDTHSPVSRKVETGDKVFVRISSPHHGMHTLAEYNLNEVVSFDSIFRELRRKSQNLRGLVKLYVRNITKGWSIEQPFIFRRERLQLAASLTHPFSQPETSAPKITG